MNDHRDHARNGSDEPSFERLTADLGRVAKQTETTPRIGFKDALRLRVLEAVAARRTTMSRFKLAAALSPALVVLIIAVIVFQPFFGVRTVYANDAFTLVPEESDALGVAPESAFVLESREPISASDIDALLVASTKREVPRRVEQISDKRLRVAFDAALTPDEVVRFQLPTTETRPDGTSAMRDYRWAFQVRGDFRVSSTIPGDQSSGVPTDAGFEFTMSHENVDPKAFERALRIEPRVDGHVEVSRRSFVFVPDDPLEAETVYSVTLSGDLAAEGSGETLGEDYAFTFETGAEGGREDRQFNLVDRFATVSPEEIPALDYASDAGERPHVRLYRLDSFEEYLSAMRAGRALSWRAFATAEHLADLSGAPAYEFDAETGGYDWQRQMVFPEPIAKGYYVMDVTVGRDRDWALIASSSLTAYVSRAENQTLFWVNDAVSGQPVEGAAVGYAGDGDATTGADGLASVATAPDQDNIVEIRRRDDAVALLLTSGAVTLGNDGKVSWSVPPVPDGAAGDHWALLYADRPTYKTDDTLEFWGYAERRDDGSRPERVFVDAGFDAAYADVSPEGTYGGSFVLRHVQPGTYQLSVWSADPTLPGPAPVRFSGRSISVTNYAKPAYTLSVEPDTSAAFAGGEVGFTVHGQYFEGTPVKGLEVLVLSDVGEQRLALDTAGNARGTFLFPYDDGERYPRSAWISARPARPEEGDMESGASVRLFGPKVYIDTPSEPEGIVNGVGTVVATIRNTEAIDAYLPEDFAPTVRAGQSVEGKITEITYVRLENGTSYDFARKRTVTNYRYDRVQREIGSFAATSDERGEIRHAFAATNPEANYRVELSARDELGRTDRTEVTLWARQDFEYGESEELVFHNDDSEENVWEFPGYGVGEEVRLSVRKNGRAFEPAEGGRFLFYQAQRGIRETKIGTSAAYVFPFEADDVPNVSVYGVYFEKGGYRTVGPNGWWNESGGYPVSFRKTDAALTVNVTPDRPAYAPGAEARLAVRVTDPAGNPVEAEVLVNVVDEAYYALFPETVDPLRDLYRWVDDGVVFTGVTSSLDATMAGAEKGGGGDRALGRSRFKDTALFTTVRTDARGEAAVVLPVPDNVTSWRVTAQALDADGKRAGHAVANADASLPFFLMPVLREEYLAADEPVALVRASGTRLGLGEIVTYRVSIPDAEYERTLSAPASETVRVPLPDLSLGPHAVTVSGSAGALEDRVTRTVKIVESRLARPVVSRAQAGAEESLAVGGPVDGYAEVAFMDAGAGSLYAELREIAGRPGDRADEAASRVAAAELLASAFGEVEPAPSFPVEAYQGSGIRLLPYGDEDAELSARVSLLRDTPFDEALLASYFERKLDGEDGKLGARDRAQALAALAALGEPVLAELQRAAPALSEDADARLWVALGLSASGDDEAARGLYRAAMEDVERRDGRAWLPDGDDATTLERTALAAALAAALNESDRDALHAYVSSASEGVTSVALERALYAKEALRFLSNDEARVSYVLRGERREARVRGAQIERLLLSAEGVSSLDARVERGSVAVVSRYETPLVDPDAPRDPGLALRRAYAGLDGASRTTFGEGELVRVEIAYDLPSEERCGENGPLPCETYEVTDLLPSGLRIMPGHPDGDPCAFGPATGEDQRATFFVSRADETVCSEPKLVYYARVVTPGTYLAEPAYVRSVRNPSRNNHSDAVSLVISD